MTWFQALAASPTVERAGWTLLHSSWQCLAIAVGLALMLPGIRKRGARPAYAACLGALLLTVVTPAITFFLIPLDTQPSSASLFANGESPASAAIPAERATSVASVPKRIDTADETKRDTKRATAAATDDPVALSAAFPPTISQRGAELWQQIPETLSATLSATVPWLVAFWTLGVFGLSLWSLGGWFAVQRLKSRNVKSVPAVLQEAAARLAQQLGLSRAVRLWQSAIVESPVVIGAFKPVILLPASLVTELPADQLESLVAHELAHVLRHDYLVNLVQTAIETLLFYHPAVWWISSKVRSERENCCDDLAVGLAPNRAIYVRALAALSGARGTAIVPAATGGILLPRLQRILGSDVPRREEPFRFLSGVVLLAVGASSLSFLTESARPATGLTVAFASNEPKDDRSSERAANPAKPGDVVTSGSVVVRVLDADEQPLAGAQVAVTVNTRDRTFKATPTYTADARGAAAVRLPKALRLLKLVVSKPGYPEETLRYTANPQAREVFVPDDVTIHLTKGVTIGGTVVNEEHRPVSGAVVKYAYNAWEFKHDPVVTDSAGRWKFDGVRSQPTQKIYIAALHADYVCDVDDGRFWLPKQPVDTAQLQSQTAILMLKRGLRPGGRVTDASGKPVAGAIVTWSHDAFSQLRSHQIVTDAQGNYRLPPIAAGKTRLSVLAEGWRPETREVAITEQLATVDFHLKKGKRLRLRLVDDGGRPVSGAQLLIQDWHHTSVLYNTKYPLRIDLPIPDKADKNGIYEWTWAPDDAVTYAIFQDDEVLEPRIDFTAGDREQIVTVHRPLRFRGIVRDAATGQPIKRFLAIPVIHFRPDFSTLNRNDARLQEAGRLDLALTRTDIQHGLQIEAPGYRIYRTTQRYRVGDPDPELDIRLERAERSLGRVLGADGRPATDAQIYVVTKFQDLYLLNARSIESYDNYRVSPSQSGEFEINSQMEPYTVVAVSRNGYAEVERQAGQLPGELTLKPFAQVTGRLMQSGHPVPNYPVSLFPIRFLGGEQPALHDFWSTTTDESGNFAFKDVAPVPCRVLATLGFGRETPLHSSESVPLRLSPGERRHVVLGGNGIDVTGELRVEQQPAGFDYHFAVNYLVARKDGIEQPAALADKHFDWRNGWSDSWHNTQQGKAYLHTLHNWYAKPEPDGRFRISGVEPGEYDFAINLYGPTEGCLIHPLATRVVRVTVNPGDTGLDLGKLAIPSCPLPSVGGIAGDFTFQTPDGGKSSLAALRGNYVLVDFWATWCEPCVAKLDAVEHLREQFQGDKKLLVVGANLDAEIDRAKDFLKNKRLPWQHALLGEWSSTDVPRRFAISSVPAYVLIGPDGRILAHEISLEAIEAKIAQIKGTQRNKPH